MLALLGAKRSSMLQRVAIKYQSFNCFSRFSPFLRIEANNIVELLRVSLPCDWVEDFFETGENQSFIRLGQGLSTQ